MTSPIRSHGSWKTGGIGGFVPNPPVAELRSSRAGKRERTFPPPQCLFRQRLKNRIPLLHVYELEREAGVIRLEVADDGLELVNFLAHDSHFLIHDLGLDFEP